MPRRPPRLIVATVLVLAYARIACHADAVVDPTKSPSILRPNGADVWTVGSVQTIRWSNAGLDITKEQGRVVLGYLDPVSGGDIEYQEQALADGFLLADEVVNVVTPAVPSGNFYYILLLGNADNASPIFSIVNPASPQENTQNVTFPTRLSIAPAPTATVSHSSSGTLTLPTTTLSTSASSTSPTASGTSGTCRPSKGDALSWFLMAICGITVCLAA